MELTTILNRCHRFRGLVYEHARFNTDKKSIEVILRPRKHRMPGEIQGFFTAMVRSTEVVL